MDTGTGKLAPLSPTIADMLKDKSMSDYVFQVGETVQIKKSKFKVTEISLQTLILQLIPDDSFQQVPQQ